MKAPLVLLAALAACATPDTVRGPYTSPAELPRDTSRADALVEAAAAARDADPAKAEALLRDALTADLFHAEAHNNLGVLLLARGDLYGAAHEFEWARKLLPGHPEPRLNLALTLERAGQAQAAESSYAAALDVHPGYMPALQGAARLALAEGRPSAALPQWLAEIALSGETEEWRAWARARAAGLPPGR